MTPTADALKGLAGALDEVADMLQGADNPYDNGSGHWWLWKERRARVLAAARAALAAFESRGRLRDDEAFYTQLTAVLVRRGFHPSTSANIAFALADAVESALFGPATRETP